MRISHFFLYILGLVLILPACEPPEQSAAPSFSERRNLERTDNAEIESKIDQLLAEMTLEEKIGQMIQINNSEYSLSENRGTHFGAPPDVQVSIDTTKLITFIEKYKIGSFLNGVAVSKERWRDYSQQLQEVNMRYNRLKIPIIYGVDHMHGANYLENSTIFPHSINIAATFRTQFSTDEAVAVGQETAAIGHHWIFCPVVDLGANPVWPRFYETYGEDPYLSSVMGAAYVKGLQDNVNTAPYRQAATAKHFIGYSDPDNGWDRTPADISDQRLQEFFVPPFQALVDAGIKSFMINGGEVSGIPVHASYELLTVLLRDQMGFKGVVVTDWEDVVRLHSQHKVAKDMKEATYKAVMAGIDMSMTPYTTNFFDALKELVEEGRVPLERIDLSVARVLRLKLELGLFDDPYPVQTDPPATRSEENVKNALEAARESLVLIKNEGILPLAKNTRKLVVAGMNADSKRGLSGGWTLRWIPDSDDLFPSYVPTVFNALKKEFDQTQVELATAADIASKATNADAIILAVGEEPYSETPGNIYDMNLDKDQQDLIKRAQATGKPVILIMVAGRPRLVTELLPETGAFLWAGLPGFEGGTAIAEVLSGKVNPSGKMPFTYPAFVSHWYPYNHKNMERFFSHADSMNTIAGFGHGLSYTSFSYTDLKLDKSQITGQESTTASITITNTGNRAGKESVLWFIKDEVGTVTRPVKALKHFEKITLQPGESKTLTFEVNPHEDLSYPSKSGEKVLEPGDFKVICGGLEKAFVLN